MPGGVWGMSFAHFGLGLVILGGLGASVLTLEHISRTPLNTPITLGNYEFTLEEVSQKTIDNYQAYQGRMRVAKRGGGDEFYLYPERRIYIVGGMETTEAAIRSSIMDDVYVVIGEVTSESNELGYVVRLYVKPFVPWMWVGCLLMVIGAFISLADRRLRLGAPALRGRQLAATKGAISNA